MTSWLRGGLPLFGAAMLLYAVLLPFPGIQWGDGLEFAAVAHNLGVSHPTGYPLFTLLGWPFVRLPLTEPYKGYLLLCRLFVVGLGVAMLWQLRWQAKGTVDDPALEHRLPLIATALLVLSPPVYRTMFSVEVYSFGAALMAASLAALVWGKRTRHVILGGFFLGLAASNHLPSLALLPLLIARVLTDWYRCPRAPLVAPALAFLAPPLVLYGTLPLRVPPTDGWGIGWGGVTTLPALWDHLRGGEYRHYQFMSDSAGNPFSAAAFRAFLVQRVGQSLDAFGALLIGAGSMARLAGVLVVGAAICGAVTAFRRWPSRIVTAAFLLAPLLQLGFVFTYNIPDIEDYFLGILVLAFPFIFEGAIAAARAFHGTIPEANRTRLVTTVAALLMICSATAGLVSRPHPGELPELWRDRLLAHLPQGAGLLTTTDADIYTVWYEQMARGSRTDICAFSINFHRFPWFRQSMPPGDPRRGAVEFVPGPPPIGPGKFHEDLAALVIEPMLALGPLYATIGSPVDLQMLQRRYQVDLVARLLTDEELAYLERRGEVNVAPAGLFEIKRLPARRSLE